MDQGQVDEADNRLRAARRENLAQDHQFRSCCHDALARVEAAWQAYDQGEEPPDRRAVGRALGHSEVAPAFLRLHPLSRHEQLELARCVAQVGGRQSAGAHLLAGLIHLQGCNAGAAEASLSQALQLDPRCEVAGSTLALLKLDRGDLAGAQLLAPHDEQRPGMGTWVAAERARQAALRPTAGRNEPCPCGSGQKFKRCCHRRASLTLRQRVPVVIQRLWVFARDPQQRFATIELAAHALDRSRPDLVEALLPLPTDPFILDLAIHESGLGHDYLDERGPLLVDDERELLEAALAAQRRLWQVVAVLSHERLRVQDVAGGDPVEVVDMRDGQRHDTGELILARAVPIDGHLTWFGMPLEVLPSERDHLVDLLHDGGTDANRLAAWYGSRPSIDDLDATIDLADDNFPFDDADDPALAEAYRIIDARFAEHRPTVLDRR